MSERHYINAPQDQVADLLSGKQDVWREKVHNLKFKPVDSRGYNKGTDKYFADFISEFGHTSLRKPKYQIGDTLWMREEWQWDERFAWSFYVEYPDFSYKKLIAEEYCLLKEVDQCVTQSASSMPDEFIRLKFKITGVEVKKLGDIIYDDYYDNKCKHVIHELVVSHREAFLSQWGIKERNPDQYFFEYKLEKELEG